MNYSSDATGILVPDLPVVHWDNEYDSAKFDVLRDMQSRHFWYQGRHRFLLQAVRDELGHMGEREEGLQAIDLGGGCGGWIDYLQQRLPQAFSELALADSSRRALEFSRQLVGDSVARYQTDLLRLGWEDRWDMAFLLDVLEHIPNHIEVMAQIKQALRPGGLLFVTTPALKCFWSYNDQMAHHVRRYSKSDFARIAEAAGWSLCKARYFMFLLSPLLWLSRLKRKDLSRMSKEEMFDLARHTHRVPAAPINGLLRCIFKLETPLGLRLPFPWGTSILGVFQKPR